MHLGQQQHPDEVRVVLPGYRGEYSANDFHDLQTRKIDEVLSEYLVDKVKWPQWHRPRRVVFELPGEAPTDQGERTTRTAYRNMLGVCAARCGRRLTNLVPKILLLVVAGLSMIHLSNLLGDTDPQTTFRKTLAEVARVGGWVAMWTAVALLFYDGTKTLNRLLAFRRLRRLPIEFEYRVGRKLCLPNDTSPTHTKRVQSGRETGDSESHSVW